MRKLFLIPLMTLLTCVMAWAATGDLKAIASVGENIYYYEEGLSANNPENRHYKNESQALYAALTDVLADDTVKLENDIESSSSFQLETTSACTLDLNGHVLSTSNMTIIFAMADMTISNGTIKGLVAYGYGIYDEVEISLSDVNLQPSSYPVIPLSINGGSVIMDGGSINGNVSVASGCSFTMNSGTINGDISGDNTEVVDVLNSTFTMNGGTINMNGNTISKEIAAVHVRNYGTFTMNGGTINANFETVSDEIMGVKVFNGSTFTMEDGAINVAGNSNNYVYVYGVYVDGTANSSSLSVNGGAITADGSYGCAVSVWKGAELNVAGGTLTGSIYGIAGNGSSGNGGTTINISGGTITGTEVGIYHPQPGNSTLTITNGNVNGYNSAIEMRAGTLDIDGGNFTATATEFLNVANSSGTTTMGAALAVAQHTTEQPISIDISGGIFRGIYPIAQANPQENAQEFIDHVNIAVSGGQFWATNTANVAAYTENNKLSLTGGYYNLAPHAFVAANYVAVNNPKSSDDDIAAFNDGYLFKVVQLQSETFESTLTEGNWVVETTWQDNPSVSAQIPTQQSNVTIPNGGNVYVQPNSEEEVVAYAHNLTLTGNASLTVKDGATLVLGNEANVANTANLVVEAGGQLLIAPSESEVHPVGSVTLIADAAGLKEEGLNDSEPNNLYWQHFAIPTTVAPTIRVKDKNGQEITESITYYNTWNIVNGWENVLKTDMNTPFQGYNLSNDRVYGSDIRYIFTGPLVGNASNPLVFARRGFSFFGNSYLAPINIRALQAAMYEQGMEYTVYVYVHRNASGPQIYRAINDVTAGIYGIDEIKPLEGFFMFAEEASQADFQYNSAVYSAFLNKQMGGNTVDNAPVRNAKPAYDAKAVVAVEAQNGESDEVILVASENFSNDYDLKADARKMENSGMNIYADGAFDDLAVMATNDLMGQTLSFRAGKDALYTMTFSNVEGELALYDKVAGKTIAVAENGTYTFAAQPNTTTAGRFEVVPVAKVPTAIENTEVKANIKGIYSITGMYLGENFNALPKGVYVVNGVKIVK